MISTMRRWWTEDCGGRDILRLALPLVVSTGFFALTLFVDRMFLFWYSREAMAASMPSGTLHWAMVCFPLGLAQYANTFVAQYYGAGRMDRIGPVIWQSARIGLYALPFFMVTAPISPWVFRAVGHAESMSVLETQYFQVLLLGAPASVVCGALSSFFTGRGETRTVMYVNIITTGVNVVFDYLWIFGKAGFPEMGIVGAALATAAANWVQAILYCYLISRPDTVRQYGFANWRFDGPLFRRIVFYGAPNGLQWFVESSAFAVIMLQFGELGANELAATTIAFNVNAVAFIPLMGISIAVSTLVGQQLMHARSDLAARATWSGIAWALAYSFAFGILYLFFPDALMAGHAVGATVPAHAEVQTASPDVLSGATEVAKSVGRYDPDFEEIRRTATILLRFVAAYCLFDALQIVFVGAIKGAGDTWFVLISSIIVAFLAVTIGWLGDFLYGGGLYWWWSVVTAWIFTLGLLFGGRFLQGRWKSMRVIESNVVEAA